jgi:hypothetical protein
MFEGRRKLPATLEEARIRSLPGDAFYIPDFITPEEEQRLLQKVGPFRLGSFIPIFRASPPSAAPHFVMFPMMAWPSGASFTQDKEDADYDFFWSVLVDPDCYFSHVSIRQKNREGKEIQGTRSTK